MASAGGSGEALNAFEDLMGRGFNAVSQTLANTMPGSDVSLVASNVAVVTVPELLEQVEGEVVRGVAFLSGSVPESPVVCCLPIDDAKAAVDLMSGGTGEEPPAEFEDYHLSAAGELVKYVVQAIAEHATAELGQATEASVDDVAVISLADETDDLADLAGDDGIMLVTASYICGAPVIAFYLAISVSLASALGEMLAPAEEPEPEPAPEPEPEAEPDVPAPASSGGGLLSEEEIAAVLGGLPDEDETATSTEGIELPVTPAEPAPAAAAAAPAPAASPSAPTASAVGLGPAPQARPIEYEDLGGEQSAGPAGENFQLIANIPVQLSVELGRTKRTLGEILEFGTGSTIQLDKAADEPVDILAGGKHIAKGEVVVIDDNFAVRIRQILKPIRGIMPEEEGGG